MTFRYCFSYSQFSTSVRLRSCLTSSGRLASTLLMTLGLLACGKPAETNGYDTHKTSDSKPKSNLILNSYQVSVDADYPPYSFRDEQGNAIGFDVDMLRSIGEVEGFTVDFDPVPWDTVMPAVQQGKYQIGLGGIARSDVEEQELISKVLLTNPYTYGRDAVAIRQDNASVDIKSVIGLDSLSNLRIATIGDSGYIDDIEKLQKDTTITLVKEETTFLAYKDLFNGTADVVVADQGVLEYLKKKNPKLPITIGGKGKYFDDPYGMVYVVGQTHPELHTKINHGITTLVANGTFHKIHTKWFGVPPTYIPGKLQYQRFASSTVRVNTDK